MAETLRPWGPVVVPPRLDERSLGHYLQLVLALNVDYLREVPQTPDLYASGVRYVPEPPGVERWLSIPWLRLQGHSVCHSLCAYRVAELRVKYGEPARFAWHEEPPLPDGTALWHVRVLRARAVKPGDSQLEDPSLILGMGGTQAWIQKFGPIHRVDAVAGRVVHIVG